MSTEDARSDVILAAAAAVFGISVVAFLQQLPFYPHRGLAGVALQLFWVFALTGLVPYLLTRYRQLGAESYGLETGRDGLRSGLLLALPVVVAGILRGIPLRGSVGQAALGRFSAFLPGDPTVSDAATGAASIVLDGAIQLALVLLLIAGALLLYPFLTVRGRDAFSRHDVSATETVRTFGMGAVAAALVFGLLRSIASDLSALGVLVNVVALVALVLLGDRLVPAKAMTSRAAIVTPVVVAFLAQLLPALRGDVLFGLYAGSLAAGIVAVLASVIEGRAFAWAVIPPVVAMAIYPTCLSPLPFAAGTFGC
ncbi:MAG: hypothetical protein KY457_08520 [Actinobacteria bacterium]|nr:hypothetical protein [Actinomycetota bacterium]